MKDCRILRIPGGTPTHMEIWYEGKIHSSWEPTSDGLDHGCSPLLREDDSNITTEAAQYLVYSHVKPFSETGKIHGVEPSVRTDPA